MEHLLVHLHMILILSSSTASADLVPCTKEATWLEAKYCCESQNLTLPYISEGETPSYKNVEDIQESWAGVRRRIFNSWEWIDGSAGRALADAALGQDCAFYNHKIGHLEAGRCDDTTVFGSICEVPDCRQCLALKPILHQVCAWFNETCYIYLCNEFTWHEARAHCRQRGWEIARVKNDKIKRILGSGHFGCNKFWIGLRRDDWTGMDTKKRDNVYNFLEIKDPSARCSTLNVSTLYNKLQTTSCSATKKYLCLGSNDASYQKAEINVSTTRTTFLEEKNYGNHLGIIIGSAISLAIIIIILVLGITFYYRRLYKILGSTNKKAANQDIELAEDLLANTSETQCKPGVCSERIEKEVPIVTVSRDGKPVLHIDNVLDVFNKGDAKHLRVAIFSIIGPSKSGKSFIMNLLLNYLKALENDPETNWFDVSSEQTINGFPWNLNEEHSEPSICMWGRPFIVPTEDGRMAVLLVDTNALFGEFCSEKASGALVSITALLSSVLLYNIRSKIQADDIQNIQKWLSLGLSDILNAETSEYTAKRLIFLVRDWIDGKRYPYGVEGGAMYIEDKLKNKGNKSEGEMSRQYIRSNFERAECFLLPHPGICVMNTDEEAEYTVDWSAFCKNFRKKLNVLVPYIFQDLRKQIKSSANSSMTGEEFCSFLEDIFQDYYQGV